MDELKSSIDTAEDKISDYEDRSIEYFKTEAKREKRMARTPETWKHETIETQWEGLIRSD